MADYTAFVEASNALVDLLRDMLTPEPMDNREAISLCSPHESENNQLTLYLYHIEETNQPLNAGYRMEGRDTQRIPPAEYTLHFLATPHSKAPAQLKEADQYRIMGALVQIIRDYPVIPQKYLSGSAAEERAQLHVAMERIPLEQLLKIWNNTSKDYKLSVSIQLTGVSIRSNRERRVTRVTDITMETEEIPQDRGRQI